ncbi:nucleoside phosphorylase domain-containing protein [Phyllosticta citribraziliensis]
MSSKRPYRTCNQYSIGLITALAIELAAVNAMLDETHDYPQDLDAVSDDNNYQFGRIGSHNVVIASLPAKVHGKVSAATTAIQTAKAFPHIRFGLFIGIGGGVPNLDLEQDVRLGDVVVGLPGGTSGGIIQYDLGKVTNQGFKRTGTLSKPPKKLLAAVQSLQAKHEGEDSRIPALIEEAFQKYPKLKRSNPGYSFQGAENDNLFQSDYEHAGGTKCTNCRKDRTIFREERVEPEQPRIHYGMIASGDSVIKSAKVRDSVAQALKVENDVNCLCFEMEAAGLEDFPSLVVRGVSDYADSHKNDRWQRYAAMTAAAFAKEVLQNIGAKQVEAISTIREVVNGLDQC